MENSNVECRLKALKKLVSEFNEEKYASFIKGELELLESGEKEKIGFQSESDDVVLALTCEKGVIEYDYWDNDVNDFVKGEGDLEYSVITNEIRAITG